MLPPTLSWLVRSSLHAALAHEAREHAVHDGGADLALDVVADDRHAGLDEALLPVGLAGDEHGDAVDHGAAGGEDLLRVPLGGLFAAHGQVVDDHVGLRLLEDADDVGGRAGRLLDDLREVLAEAVVGHAAHDLDALLGHVAELHRVVGLGEDGLAEVLADLVLVDVDGGHELDVADVVAADDGMHEAGDEVGLLGVLVELHALDERRGAVADADDRYAYWIAQDRSTSTACGRCAAASMRGARGTCENRAAGLTITRESISQGPRPPPGRPASRPREASRPAPVGRPAARELAQHVQHAVHDGERREHGEQVQMSDGEQARRRRTCQPANRKPEAEHRRCARAAT